jgi:hypoxanthine phosphoribosyltransferase
MPTPDDDVAEILITAEELKSRIHALGQQISADYEGEDLLLVCVLKGAVTFLADLMRQITIPHSVDFMAISSYGASTESSGIVRILKDLDTNISGRSVLIVEDIIDTGRTLHYITQNLRTRNPKSVRICTLLSKPSRREIDIPLDYVGFEIPNKFVVGYGLDFGEIYRSQTMVEPGIRPVALADAGRAAAFSPAEHRKRCCRRPVGEAL